MPQVMHIVHRDGLMTFDAMGTRWYIERLDGVFDMRLARRVVERVEMFCRNYSRFTQDSYVTLLNRGETIHHPSQELRNMLDFARFMYIATDGVFDISIGGVLQKHGYGNMSNARDTVKNIWKYAKISEQEVCFTTDVSIDFGGFGKGWMIDELASMLDEGDARYIINGGGDIFVHSDTPVELGLEHPQNLDTLIGTTKLLRGALCVSSTLKRRWKMGDTTHHHIIDPAKNAPAQQRAVGSYVRTSMAVIADVLAPVVLVRPDLRVRFSEQFDAKIILVDSSGTRL